MSGDLYIVATPIGNLKDITLRALEVLKSVDIILAEDTRTTNTLLKHYDIDTYSMSYHQQSDVKKFLEILRLLQEGKNVALVTDAGTPGISDPGNELISFLLDQLPDLKVISVPGASSLTAALSVSGMNTSEFMFIGFWPKKKANKVIEKIKLANCPVVFFDSPFRILKTLDLLESNFPNAKIFIGQELTKLHERNLKGSVNEVKEKLLQEQKDLGRVKGELVCIINAS
jgi:16S rRNA (cytidine1402-2'-O)-methyltransferase